MRYPFPAVRCTQEEVSLGAFSPRRGISRATAEPSRLGLLGPRRRVTTRVTRSPSPRPQQDRREGLAPALELSPSRSRRHQQRPTRRELHPPRHRHLAGHAPGRVPASPSAYWHRSASTGTLGSHTRIRAPSHGAEDNREARRVTWPPRPQSTGAPRSPDLDIAHGRARPRAPQFPPASTPRGPCPRPPHSRSPGCQRAQFLAAFVTVAAPQDFVTYPPDRSPAA